MWHDLHFRWLLLGNRPIYLIRLCSFPFACSMPSILLLSFGFGFVQQSNYCLFYSDFRTIIFPVSLLQQPLSKRYTVHRFIRTEQLQVCLQAGTPMRRYALRVVNGLLANILSDSDFDTLVEALIQVFWHGQLFIITTIGPRLWLL